MVSVDVPGISVDMFHHIIGIKVFNQTSKAEIETPSSSGKLPLKDSPTSTPVKEDDSSNSNGFYTMYVFIFNLKDCVIVKRMVFNGIINYCVLFVWGFYSFKGNFPSLIDF